jgi:hypothetical protein
MTANDIRYELLGGHLHASALANLVAQGRFELGSEKATQQGIHELLADTLHPGVGLCREHRLAPGDVVDFFIRQTGVAIEVKLKRNSARGILRQLERYARHDQVQALVLVTNRAMGLPPEVGGKPTYYVSLGRAWL